jgi:hypothetical protein
VIREARSTFDRPRGLAIARALLLVAAAVAGCTSTNPDYLGSGAPDLHAAVDLRRPATPDLAGADLVFVPDLVGANCGSPPLQCCSGDLCVGASVCRNGECVDCGGDRQACCANRTCTAGNVCHNDVCLACGNVGQICCAGDACGQGQACVRGVCQVCGSVGEACCGNTKNPCGKNGSCVNGICQACGNVGDICCGNACAKGSVCVIGFCQACGGGGEPCCANGQCGNNLSCSNGICR